MQLHKAFLRLAVMAILLTTLLSEGLQRAWAIPIATNSVSGPDDSNNQDDDDDPCDPPAANDGPSGGDNPCGMPVWRVSEPFINVWIHDTPLRYRLASGRWQELKLSYKHRTEWEDRRSAICGFGEKWECNWIGVIEMNDQQHKTNYLAGGGKVVFSDYKVYHTPEYRSGRRLLIDGPPIIHSSTGSQNHYGFQWTDLGQDRIFRLLTKRADRYGRTVDFHWEMGSAGFAALKFVYDREGRKCSLGYTNTAFPHQITSVTDPYGRSAFFIYDENARLTNIIDMAGMTSSFSYDSSGRITTLHTPYGNTSFDYYDAVISKSNVFTLSLDRAVKVTEADGGQQLFVYRDQGSITNGEVITNVCGWFASNDPDYYNRNSFHFDRAQFAAISQAGLSDVLDMPKEDYWKASIKHWLKEPLIGHLMISDTPSDTAGPVLQPIQSDIRSGQVHFEYQGATVAGFVGSQKH